MPRSRREKSASISSATAPVVNGSMGPPSPVSPTRSSPAATRRRRASTANKPAGGAAAQIPQAKSSHAPGRAPAAEFALAVLISFVAQAATRFVVNTGELGTTANRAPSWWSVGGQLVWKITLQGICWFGGYDAVDVASLNALLETPKFILLHYFYNISSFTLVANSTISILSQALPFYLMRPLSAPHAATPTVVGTGKQAVRLRNRTIINDPVTTLATSATSTLTYTVVLLLARTFPWAPAFLVTHFDALPVISFALPESVSTTLVSLVLWLSPAGIASTQFLFRPAEGASSSSSSATGANSIALTHSHFDPATASFTQHLYYNVWGWYTSRQRELIGRSTVLGAFLLAETVIHLTSEVRGVDVIGAFGYAAPWVLGTVVLGGVLDWVGGPSD